VSYSLKPYWSISHIRTDEAGLSTIKMWSDTRTKMVNRTIGYTSS
jgi:hypothetical protein